MPYAKASTPTNIAHSNPPNQLSNIQFRLLPNHSPYSKTHRFFSHTSHYISHTLLPRTRHEIHNARAATSNAAFNMQLRLVSFFSPLPVWQYTLNTSQPCMNQQTVSSLQYSPRRRVHRLCKRTTKYLLNHKMTHCSTYTTPDLPPTFAARLALCKGIHSNKYPPAQILPTNSQHTTSAPS